MSDHCQGTSWGIQQREMCRGREWLNRMWLLSVEQDVGTTWQEVTFVFVLNFCRLLFRRYVLNISPIMAMYKIIIDIHAR